MTREEMLNELHRLKFCIIWPGNWQDIDFTERPIWVSSAGYGYYACDEPCHFENEYVGQNRTPRPRKLNSAVAATEHLRRRN